MALVLRLVCLFYLASMPGFAGTWSGWLVDSKCYASIDNNRSDPENFSDWDRNLAIRYCLPDKDTRSFAVVQQDGSSFKFDPAGNEKAIDLRLNADTKSLFIVKVTGQMSRNTVTVSAISVAERINCKRAPGL